MIVHGARESLLPRTMGGVLSPFLGNNSDTPILLSTQFFP